MGLTLSLNFSRLLLPVIVRHHGDVDLDLVKSPTKAVVSSLGLPQLATVPFQYRLGNPTVSWGRLQGNEQEFIQQVAAMLRRPEHLCGFVNWCLLISRAHQYIFSFQPWHSSELC